MPSVPLFAPPSQWLDKFVEECTRLTPPGSFFHYSFNINALLALILVSLCCGAVGSLVVGGRMAFFSDALAHCSFAGISIGFLLFTGLLASRRPPREFWDWATLVMVVFGILAGCGIVWVRTRTGLSSDTVIGVFFAGAVGLAAALSSLFIRSRELFNLEDFLFGNPILVKSEDLVILACLTVFTAGPLARLYNQMMLAGFNNSLALSRRVPVQLLNYLFIILLAVIVNLCLRFVGALLINALLIIPAAAAINVSRNMRQLFWLTIGLTLFVGVGGQWLQWELNWGAEVKLNISGTIVLLSVCVFVLSMIAGPWLRARRTM
jgi:zinc transport system permease protein